MKKNLLGLVTAVILLAVSGDAHAAPPRLGGAFKPYGANPQVAVEKATAAARPVEQLRISEAQKAQATRTQKAEQRAAQKKAAADAKMAAKARAKAEAQAQKFAQSKAGKQLKMKLEGNVKAIQGTKPRNLSTEQRLAEEARMEAEAAQTLKAQVAKESQGFQQAERLAQQASGQAQQFVKPQMTPLTKKQQAKELNKESVRLETLARTIKNPGQRRKQIKQNTQDLKKLKEELLRTSVAPAA